MQAGSKLLARGLPVADAPRPMLTDAPCDVPVQGCATLLLAILGKSRWRSFGRSAVQGCRCGKSRAPDMNSGALQQSGKILVA